MPVLSRGKWFFLAKGLGGNEYPSCGEISEYWNLSGHKTENTVYTDLLLPEIFKSNNDWAPGSD